MDAEKRAKALNLFKEDDMNELKNAEMLNHYLIKFTLYSASINYDEWKRASEKGVNIEESIKKSLDAANERRQNERHFELLKIDKVSFVVLLSSITALRRIQISRYCGSISKDLYNNYNFKELLVIKSRLFDLDIIEVDKNMDVIAKM